MRATAYHEAAHAVAYKVFGYPVAEVSVAPTFEGKMGHTLGGPVLPKGMETLTRWRREDIGESAWQAARNDTVIFLAGEVAEAKLGGRRYKLDPNSEEAHNSDEMQALGRVGRMHPADTGAQDQLLEELHREAELLVQENWQAIQGVAMELIERQSLRAADIDALLRLAEQSTTEHAGSYNDIRPPD